MREGLRSCGLRGRDIVMDEVEEDREAGEVRDVMGMAGEEEGDGFTPKEECGEVIEVSEAAGDGRKLRSVEDGGFGKRKRARKGVFGVDAGVGVPVRVLRSRVVMGRGKEERGHSVDVEPRGSNGPEGETERDVNVHGSRMSDNDENQKVEELLDATDQSASGQILKRKRGKPSKLPISNGVVMKDEDGGNAVTLGCEKKEDVAKENLEGGQIKSLQVEKGDGGVNLKKRRGRPPKSQSNDGDNLVAEPKKNVDVKDMGMEESGTAEVGNGDGGKNLKKKRGRPPKMQVSDGVPEEGENDISTSEGRRDVDNMGKKEYKSAKVEKGHEGVNSNRKRGRPPKSQSTDGVAKKGDVGVTKGILVGEEGNDLAKEKLSKVGIEPDEVTKRTRGSNESENERQGKRLDESHEPAILLKSKVGRPPKSLNSGSLDENSVEEEKPAGSGKCQAGSKLRQSVNKASDKRSKGAKGSKCKNKKVGENTEGDEGVPRSTAKQMVRDKIVAMLLKAGWTVEYRPRNNKVYNDAVYVNPDGRTHWSVTLAYKVLKQEYENNNGHLKASEKDFVFTPLPEEELGMLARITVKQREDKGKPKKKGNIGKTNCDEVTKKKKLKDKSSVRKQDNGAERRKRYSLLVRRSNKEVESENDGYMPYLGKRTLLAWLIDSGTVPENSEVRYMNQKEQQVIREGIITRDGIKCDCCDEVFTLSEFEKHAGSELCQPCQNIYLESGASLLECQLDSWRKEEEFKSKWFHSVDVDCEDPNDDTCNLCGDGGDLICCDGCPSTFHQSCLAIENFPSGDWQCFRCTCKFCQECFRIANQQESSDNTSASALNICRLCEEKYHEECVGEMSAIKDDTTLSTFCGKTCQEIFKRLQQILGVRQELEDGFSWRLIQRTDVDSDLSHNETQKNLEGNSKLAIALSVMNECFLPLFDHKSGVNLMCNILYSCGSNFTRLNYTGFYTAILERGDEVIAVACIRIHGSHLAEMPFIGVRDLYRRQGMCRRLLGAIESGLGSLNVEKLVIPAVNELIETWTSIFGFKPLEPSSRLKLRNMNILVFPGTDMLQKPLLDNQPAEISFSAEVGLGSIELVHQTTHETSNSSAMGHLNGSGHKTCHVTENELTAVESNLQLFSGSSDQSFCARASVDLQELFTGKNQTVGVTSTVDDNNGCSEPNAFEEQGVRSDDNNLNSLEKDFAEIKSQIVSTVPASKDSAEDVRGALQNAFTDCSSQILLLECHQTGQNCRSEGECTSKAVASDLCMSTMGVANDLEAPNVAQIDSCSQDQDLIPDMGHLRQSEFNSQAEQTALQCTSESTSDPKSVPGIASLCASAGNNACGSEAMILSNQAS